MMTDLEYKAIVKQIMNHGQSIDSRNSPVRRLTNLSATFTSTPLVTVRRTAWKQCIAEFEWFLSGSSNLRDLDPKVHNWWKPWADEHGWVENIYGPQFRLFHGYRKVDFDQIQYLTDGIKKHPFSRRHVITVWNTADMDEQENALCHGTAIQAFANNDGTLDLTMYQRSADVIVGLPHNWLQYWAFLQWLSHQVGRKPGRFNWIGGDCHIYQEHTAIAEKILAADFQRDPPQLVYKPTSDEFKASDFTLSHEYQPAFTEAAALIV